jgi:hypothetical protein
LRKTTSRQFTTFAAIGGVLLVFHAIAQYYALFIQPDGFVYILDALALASGHVSFGLRAPLFQVATAISLSLLGPTHTAAVLAPELFGILTTVLLFSVTQRLYDTKTGLVGFLLALMNLELMNLSAQVLRETLLSALVLLCVYVLFRCRGNTRLLTLGCVIGSLYWVREDYLAILVPFVLFLIWGEKESPRAVLIMLGIAALVSAPWAYYSFQTYGTFTPSLQAANFAHINLLSYSSQSIVAVISGLYLGLHLLSSTLTVFAFIFLIIGLFAGMNRKHWLIFAISGLMLLVDARFIGSYVIHGRFSFPMPWDWTDASRYILPSSLPLLAFSAKGIVQTSEQQFSRVRLPKFRLLTIANRHRLEALLLFGLLLFGAGYVALLASLSSQTELPYARAGEYMKDKGLDGSVMCYHPELLRAYFSGEVYAIPTPANFETIFAVARTRHISYLLTDWTMNELTNDSMALLSAQPAAPQGLSYVSGQPGVWALFSIGL